MEDIWGRRSTEEATLEPDPKQIMDALYREHADRILRYALRRVRADDAHEVVAQTFVVAWRRLHDIPGDPLPWLIGITRNTIRNLERADRRRSRLETRVASAQTPTEIELHPPELSEEMSRALRSLSCDDREILFLIAWDGLDQAEAAAAMGWSRPNFRLRLHRARKRLRQRLEVDHPLSDPLACPTATPEEA
jgi:RNA polymerase sigma-70 factor (ECF subfamily)